MSTPVKMAPASNGLATVIRDEPGSTHDQAVLLSQTVGYPRT